MFPRPGQDESEVKLLTTLRFEDPSSEVRKALVHVTSSGKLLELPVAVHLKKGMSIPTSIPRSSTAKFALPWLHLIPNTVTL